MLVGRLCFPDIVVERFERRVLGDFRFVEISRDSVEISKRSPEISGDLWQFAVNHHKR
jgi:hypothetical protein